MLLGFVAPYFPESIAGDAVRAPTGCGGHWPRQQVPAAAASALLPQLDVLRNARRTFLYACIAARLRGGKASAKYQL